MIRKNYIRYIVTVVMTIGIVFPELKAEQRLPQSVVAEAVSTNAAINSASKRRKKKRKKKRRVRSRRYTLRGNPKVTRKVATDLIIDKTPHLASLVGLSRIDSLSVQSSNDSTAIGSDVDSSAAVGKSLVAVSIFSSPTTGYTDAELNEDEDPDKLNVEDEQYLEATDKELEIGNFYDEFTNYMASLNPDEEKYFTYNGIDKIAAMESLMEWLGTRYLFGGMSKKGIDCSAFTGTMYRSLGYKLPRTAAAQWEVGEKIKREDLQFGDLVFFHTRKAVYVSHVGMYLDNGMFAHASSRNGVTVSSLESNYYSTHYIGARRYEFESVEPPSEAFGDVTNPKK